MDISTGHSSRGLASLSFSLPRFHWANLAYHRSGNRCITLPAFASRQLLPYIDICLSHQAESLRIPHSSLPCRLPNLHFHFHYFIISYHAIFTYRPRIYHLSSLSAYQWHWHWQCLPSVVASAACLSLSPPWQWIEHVCRLGMEWAGRQLGSQALRISILSLKFMIRFVAACFLPAAAASDSIKWEFVLFGR